MNLFGRRLESQQKVNKMLKNRTSLLRKKRALRVRKKLKAVLSVPRLSIFKSNRLLSVQIIDDAKNMSLGGASAPKKDAAALGHKLGALAKELGLTELVLDRGPNKYHGVVARFADAVREAGMKF